jgi:hypothetical protein
MDSIVLIFVFFAKPAFHKNIIIIKYEERFQNERIVITSIKFIDELEFLIFKLRLFRVT